MKILWICNMMLPKISDHLNIMSSVGGGWLVGLSNDLKNTKDIDLTVCFPLNKKSKQVNGKIENLKYYSFPHNNTCSVETEECITEIIKKTEPDIIHIFGTEYSHTLDAVNVDNKMNILNKVVINIQGLVSVIANHYMDGISYRIQIMYTLRDILRNTNIKKEKNNFIKKGKLEIKAIEKVNHLIGRTAWDRACTYQMNPNASYHFCNETLRDEFYKHEWNIDNCDKHSIFVSQCNYPIKGFHRMLEAMPIILKFYPDTILYTTGRDIIKNEDILSKAKLTSYEYYLKHLIKKYSLQNKVIFLGGLNETKICERYLKSHVFVSPSSIENSPNSVGEAMILGVPTITSDVGGVKDMLTHTVDGVIYQHDAPYMLAHHVCEIFGNDDLALEYSSNAREHANKTHNREINLKTMISIYQKIKEN